MVRAPVPMHGKLSRIHHTGKSVFRGLNNDFMATRYHSLTIAPESMPADLEVTAVRDDGVIMGVMHKTHPVHGVQFHPESIASENGHALLQNFLRHGAHVSAGMSGTDFSALLKRVAAGETLDAEASARAFGAIMAGKRRTKRRWPASSRRWRCANPASTKLPARSRAMRAAMLTVEAPEGAIDLAARAATATARSTFRRRCLSSRRRCGVPVAKHGNRGASSRAGAADVLEKLGVKIDLVPEAARGLPANRLASVSCSRKVYHPAMKYVGPVREHSVFARSSICLGRCRTRRGSNGNCSGVYSHGVAGEAGRSAGRARCRKGLVRAWRRRPRRSDDDGRYPCGRA